MLSVLQERAGLPWFMQVLMVLGRHITDAKAGKPSREQFLCLWDTESLERAVSMDSYMLVVHVCASHRSSAAMTGFTSLRNSAKHPGLTGGRNSAAV